MTQPTLPVLGGGERGLQKGDRVQWDDGVIDTVTLHSEGMAFWLTSSGRRYWPDTGHRAVVLILGPAEETHVGEGTVTKLKTIRVHGPEDRVDLLDAVDVQDLGYFFDGSGGWNGGQETLHFAPKPTPSPTYTERLIEAVQVRPQVLQLPIKATELLWNGVHWKWRAGVDGSTVLWNPNHFGSLPPWNTGDETSIDLAVVREAAEVGK